jgi:hypothetical protein
MPAKASAAERANLEMAQALNNTAAALATAVNELQSQLQAQAQVLQEWRQATSAPSATDEAARAAHENNSRIILQNLLNP